MAEAARGSASRAELLELRREHEVVEEGHRLLDERRVLLARELLARLKAFDQRFEAFADCEKQAHAALADATERMGLEQLEVYPPLDLSGLETVRETARFIGITFDGVRLAELPEPNANVTRFSNSTRPKPPPESLPAWSKKPWAWPPTSPSCSSSKPNTGAPSAVSARWKRFCCPNWRPSRRCWKMRSRSWRSRRRCGFGWRRRGESEFSVLGFRC